MIRRGGLWGCNSAIERAQQTLSYIRCVRTRSKHHDTSRQLETQDESDHVYEYALTAASRHADDLESLWCAGRARQPALSIAIQINELMNLNETADVLG
jgi:hypothetical protein